jgi:hypothetical protein
MEATPEPRMAGCPSDLIDSQKKRIPVTIKIDLFDFLKMA